MSKPKLTFFCELGTDELSELFEGRFLIDDLKDLEAALSLGILDLSKERAQLVKRLNKAGLPVIAWLLLPEEQGYWFNADNYEHATARYLEFKAWTTKYDLEWSGVGIDIEMNINEVRQFLEQKQTKSFAKTLLHRYTDKQRAPKAKNAYQALVDLIHADGYPVESYHLPIINEERRAHSTVLQRTLGLVDVETDLEVLTLYSSFLRPNGDALLWSYAPNADSIGVGSTGGGVNIEGVIDIAPLTWEEFSRDLRLSHQKGKPIHIFSLEGCVRQDFISRLNRFDWNKKVDHPQGVMKVNLLRTGLATFLWLLQRPWVILAAAFTFVGLGFLFKNAHKPES
jgi:hypothetical protein